MPHRLTAILVQQPARTSEHLRPMLSDWLSIDVIGWAASEIEAMALVESAGRRWNLLVVDLVLQSGTGLGVVRSVQKCPDQFVLVLTSHVTEPMRARCLSLGADAVFDKSEFNAFLRFCASACLMLSCDGVARDETLRQSLLSAVEREAVPKALGKEPNKRQAPLRGRASRGMPWPTSTRPAIRAENSPFDKKRGSNAHPHKLQAGAMSVSFATSGAHGFAELLAQQLQDSAHSMQAADLIVATIASLDQTLRPVIGATGVGAMLDRSVRSAFSGQPWMGSLRGKGKGTVTSDLAALRLALEAQGVQEARKAGNSIFCSFCDLLAGMVGLPLAEELLLEVFATGSHTS